MGGLIVGEGRPLVALKVTLEVGEAPVALATDKVDVVVFNATVVVLP